MIATITLIALLPPLSAAELPPATYDAGAVAGSSSLFTSLAERMAPAYEEAQSQLSVGSHAVERFERGVLVLGPQATPALRKDLEVARRQVNGTWIQIQRHADLLAEDSEATFGAALERALADAGEGYAVKECTQPQGIMALGPGRAAPKPQCQGEDLSGALARAMDDDAVLAAAVREMLEVPWPALALTQAPMEPVPWTGTDGWVDTAELAAAFLGSPMATAGAELDRALAPLTESLEAGDPAALSAAASLRSDYERRVGELGAQLLEVGTKPLTRAGLQVALCPKPEALGACTGTNRTAEVLAVLEADKKVAKLDKP